METRRVCVWTLCGSLPLGAQFKGILDRLGGDKNASGIREALQIGLNNAIQLAAKPDGYFANTLIKILLPEKLKPVERGLRLVGGGKLIDDFVLGMNRAAEQAAPRAKDIFISALKKMTISDALQLLKGGETAATDFFRKTTSESLSQAFRPPISESMKSVGAIQSYEQMIGRFRQIPFVKAESLDIETYVTTKAVDGLFLLVAEEEKKIRKNPAARVTPLLREVFGKL
jgi:hypothetical protein